MDSYKQEKNDKLSLPIERGMEIKSVFVKYSDLDMLSWIKGLALDPCTSEVLQSSVRPLWIQTLRVRKVMALSGMELPRRKRKLQQFLKENPQCRLTPHQQRDVNQSDEQLSRASSVSCLLNSIDSSENLNHKFLSASYSSASLLTSEDHLEKKIELSHLGNAVERSTVTDICTLVESDESVNGSIPGSPQNLAFHDPSSMDMDDSVHSSVSSNCVDPKPVQLVTPGKSIGFLNIGGQCRRIVVPIGPRFQVDVPECTAKRENLDDSENLKWLGTQIWPLKRRIAEPTKKAVGKGRSASCPCMCPGSFDCTRRHILEKRVLLQSDLGPAFFSWKFNEMGEEFRRSWTLKEQESFESLAKAYPPALGDSFLKHALNCFSSKGKRSIVSFYFNVYLLKRMSMQTRSSIKRVDSDDDEVEYIEHTDSRNKNKGRRMMGSSKGVKNSYLRWC